MEWEADAIAIVSSEGEMSGHELAADLADIQGALRVAGVGPGVRFPLRNADSAALYMILGAIRMGATPCPLSSRWPEEQAKRISKTLSPNLPNAQFVVRGGKAEAFIVAKVGNVEPAALPFDEAPDAAPEPGDVVIHTSGSSGEPKAAVLSFDNLYESAEIANRHIGLAPGDRWLLSLPLYHVAGLGIVFRCMASGATIAIPDADEALEDAIERFGVTHVSLVSTQLYRLLQTDRGTRALAGLKAVLMGGSAMPEALVRKAVDAGVPILTSYGMTETATMIACTTPGDSIEHLLSSGRPLTEGAMRISDDGEIEVRGETLFQGYLQPDGSLVRPLTEDAWFCTGDLGRFDGDGYLHVTGRRDNQFVSGGENVQPEEIERALCGLPGVLEAAVVPVADAEWGQRPVAFVRTDSGQSFDPEKLRDGLGKTLAGFKIPKAILPWPDEAEASGIKIGRARWAALAEDQSSSSKPT